MQCASRSGNSTRRSSSERNPLSKKPPKARSHKQGGKRRPTKHASSAGRGSAKESKVFVDTSPDVVRDALSTHLLTILAAAKRPSSTQDQLERATGAAPNEISASLD